MSGYEEIIKDLFSRHQSVQNAGFTSDSYKPGLERIRELDERMGYPSTQFRSVHVAGTNGKGSVCSLLAASLAASGYRVGLFTSPHLLDFRERIKIVQGQGSRMIPRDNVLEFLERFDSPSLSFFEITTGMAFWYFALEKVDIAVVEVGLGGLLDSTNILEPEIAVVTSIGLDHCALLGDTRAQIATQKAGIFKCGVPAVVGERDPETEPVFEAAAAFAHCPLFFADPGDTLAPSDVILSEAKDLDLKGEYQEDNLRTVLCVLELLGEDPQWDALCHAAAITGLRGRWEKVSDRPLTIADIGHNPAALRRNFAQLEDMMAAGAYDRLIVIYGVMADKDLDGIIPLMPRAAEYFFVTPDTPRALPATAILERFIVATIGAGAPSGVILSAAKDLPAAVACPSVADAHRRALAAASPHSLIYVGGSTFVVADYLKLLQV